LIARTVVESDVGLVRLRLLQLKLGFCVDRFTIVGSGGTANLPALIYIYVFVLIASVSNLQVKSERETSAGPRHCQASGRSLVSGGIGRSTASASEQNVNVASLAAKVNSISERSRGPR
jgi:hypothetical protein